MPLYVRDRETEEAVRNYATRKGLGVTAAIRAAVCAAEAREAEAKTVEVERKLAAVRKIQKEWAKLPKLMTDEEVDAWMYDETGAPH
jgi:hypothetical protein